MPKIDDLTTEQLQQAPAEVQQIYAMGASKTPVSNKLFEDTFNKYPWYFKKELREREATDHALKYHNQRFPENKRLYI